ncbi:MAG: diacylglycerol kinase [Desulfuromonas sp.]|uniref:dihydrofolate reductase family protein n=1 Tax=Desulfuromonas sp. TaxID=892 RepID=UPI000CAB1AB3|nr:dihydrofolate reductase family protein [Desulfuromonas sp.]PLX81972.1 MAG: diacylglycerol kinase [Desulfuromonas sp.]
MKNIVYIATSLDGYIATSDGSVDWLHEIPNPSGSDYGWSELMGRIDAIVMGRNTFETVLSFGQWPYEKPVFVASSSLKEIPAHLEGKVRFIEGTPSEMVSELNGQGYENLYIDGGDTIRRFLAEDIIDEIVVTRVPILLGGGHPLFGSLTEPLKFRHAKTEVFDDILVKSTYLRER